MVCRREVVMRVIRWFVRGSWHSRCPSKSSFQDQTMQMSGTGCKITCVSPSLQLDLMKHAPRSTCNIIYLLNHECCTEKKHHYLATFNFLNGHRVQILPTVWPGDAQSPGRRPQPLVCLDKDHRSRPKSGLVATARPKGVWPGFKNTEMT